MAEPLKNMYSPAFFARIAPIIGRIVPSFDEPVFMSRIRSDGWDDLELKKRVRRVTLVLDSFLQGEYPKKIKRVIELSKAFRSDAFREQGFAVIFLADYIEYFGVEYFSESVVAMEEVTKLVSCEFAVRPFLIKYPEAMMAKMLEWASHENKNVRRLASEGCRPRLPWGKGVPFLKENPLLVIPLLEKLRNDPSDYVRRSVANNFNDITKTHSTDVLKIFKKWAGTSVETDWIIRHASRSLMKKGEVGALALQGINTKTRGQILNFRLAKKKVSIGGVLEFDFVAESMETKEARFRIDYSVDFITSTGKTSKKVFKIFEGNIPPKTSIPFGKKLSLKDLTTRKHFPGNHYISIMLNGRVAAAEKFLVTK